MPWKKLYSKGLPLVSSKIELEEVQMRAGNLNTITLFRIVYMQDEFASVSSNPPHIEE
jgi:hypothetical protein